MSTSKRTTVDQNLGNRLVLAVLITGGLMVVLDTTIINIAVRTLAEELDAPLTVVQWVSTGYTLALATVVPTTAWLVGRLGTRRVYLGAVALFTLGSALCAAAWNVESLIAFRAVQGASGALVMPVAMMIVMRTAAPDRRGRAMGLLGLPVLVGPVAGPAFGGWLVELSWRWIFLMNVPVGLLALALALRLLPVDRPAGGGDRLDATGLALIAPGLALAVYGLAESGRLGTLGSASVLVPALAGLGLIGLFLRRALRVPAPLVRVSLLRLRAVGSAAASLALFGAAFIGPIFVLPLYWQLARGLSPAQAGMIAIPQALTTGISMQIASRMVDRVPPARVVGFGITVATGGLLAVAVLLTADTPYWQVALATAVTGVGAGATVMPMVTAALRLLPEADVPSGSTLLNITSQISLSAGTALASVMLATGLAGRGVVAAGGELPTATGAAAAADRIAEACQVTLFVLAGLMAAALVVTVLALYRGSSGTPAIADRS